MTSILLPPLVIFLQYEGSHSSLLRQRRVQARHQERAASAAASGRGSSGGGSGAAGVRGAALAANRWNFLSRVVSFVPFLCVLGWRLIRRLMLIFSRFFSVIIVHFDNRPFGSALIPTYHNASPRSHLSLSPCSGSRRPLPFRSRRTRGPSPRSWRWVSRVSTWWRP